MELIGAFEGFLTAITLLIALFVVVEVIFEVAGLDSILVSRALGIATFFDSAQAYGSAVVALRRHIDAGLKPRSTQKQKQTTARCRRQ